MRQSEFPLITAINELCNGSPSAETEHFLKNADKTLLEGDITRLYGTNFDVDYVNHMILDEADGQQTSFKSIDEGTPF